MRTSHLPNIRHQSVSHCLRVVVVARQFPFEHAVFEQGTKHGGPSRDNVEGLLSVGNEFRVLLFQAGRNVHICRGGSFARAGTRRPADFGVAGPVSSGLLPVVCYGRLNSQSGESENLGVRLQHRRHATFAHDGSPPSQPPATPAPAGHLDMGEISKSGGSSARTLKRDGAAQPLRRSAHG
jgi:hypothetical protein